MKRIIVIAVLTALSLCLYGADKISSPIIKAGDNVAFVGDSITHGGHSSEYIMLYYITRYPDMRVKFLNLGIGGDSANGLLRRMDSEILKTEPKVAFLMIGMNDCSRWLYSLDSKQTAEEKEKRARGIYDSFATYVVFCEHCRYVRKTNMRPDSESKNASMFGR